jgi:phenylpyruvate tautomerase PptA (4-oxalocrotonate tautomerase family)
MPFADDAKRRDIVERVTRALAATDDDPARLTRDPVAWVHSNEIPEGNWGADIASYVTTGEVAA